MSLCVLDGIWRAIIGVTMYVEYEDFSRRLNFGMNVLQSVLSGECVA